MAKDASKKAEPTLQENIARLEQLLAGLKSDGIGHSIAGKRVDGKATFETHSPVDKSVIARVARGTPDDIDAAGAQRRDHLAHLDRLCVVRVRHALTSRHLTC